MTTVIVKGNKMVSDGLSTMGDFADQFNIKKVHKVGGYLIGFCGAFSFGKNFINNFIEAYNIGGDVLQTLSNTLPDPDTDEFSSVMILTPERQLIHYSTIDKVFYEYGNAEDGYAIGSGSVYAMSALDAGATVEEALAIAMKRDINSGGEVFIEELDEPEPELTHEDIDAMTPDQLRNKLKQLHGIL
jgi:ATP-dependent protease HslVU (ClpYQ) peptidase subunit